MDLGIRGKRGLVCAASKGLGRGCAEALAEAGAQRIAAKAVTPFLLQRIFELSRGRSLDANIALVLNNARLASRIAAAGA